MSKKEFVKDSIYIMRVKLVRPQIRIDNRNLFFSGQTLNLNGFDAGVLLKDKLRLTLGYYMLNHNLSAYSKNEDNVEFKRELTLQYGSINTEFIYKSTRFFSLGMPLEFGFGNNRLQYINSSTGEIQSKQSGFLLVSDFGLSATFKPIRWIGIRAVVGYRKTLYNQVKDFRFDSFFTSVGLNVDIREIVKDIQMYKLKRRYRKNSSSVATAVDLITD
ncbi:MAG: hypothetical protein JNJ41_16950 [Bacteroidia bacterium]|nr:hypothetical protein [Bacteroidia bacterium]